MPPTRTWRTAYLAASAVDCLLAGAAGPRTRRLRVLTKPALMPTLAASVLADPRARTSPLRTSTLAGQACSWIGDVALLRPGSRAFVTGAAAFGAGHLALLAGLRPLARPGRTVRSTPSARAATALWALAGPPLAARAAHEQPALGPVVAAYAAVLCGVVAHAGALGPGVAPTGRRLTVAGAGLFCCSDLALAWHRFVRTTDSPAWERGVMGSYCAGQLLLALGAVHA